jgi:hypothetical protein
MNNGKMLQRNQKYIASIQPIEIDFNSPLPAWCPTA